MDIKSLILAKIKEDGQVKSSEIVKRTGFSRTYVNRFFNELKNEGQIFALGRTRSVVYILPDQESLDKARRGIVHFNKIYQNSNLDEEAVWQEINKNTGVFLDLKENVAGVLHYAFTEMVNNAIDHSKSATVTVSAHRWAKSVFFLVSDKGVGVFKSIQTKFGLPDITAAIEHLLKGKQTTDPKRHTGQGLFFTSKMADSFSLRSQNKCFKFVKKFNDYFISDDLLGVGTVVMFSIDPDSEIDAAKIFAEYTNSEFEFDKTKVIVKLYKNKEGLVSRSEARRILFGLDKFERIVLDFKEVDVVGQGFADEIFRVWQNRFPNKEITYINAVANVENMIKMSL